MGISWMYLPTASWVDDPWSKDIAAPTMDWDRVMEWRRDALRAPIFDPVWASMEQDAAREALAAIVLRSRQRLPEDRYGQASPVPMPDIPYVMPWDQKPTTWTS